MTVPFHPGGERPLWLCLLCLFVSVIMLLIILSSCSLSIKSTPTSTTSTTTQQSSRRADAIAAISYRLDHDLWANDGHDHVADANRIYDAICDLKAKGQTTDQIANNIGDTAYQHGATLAQAQESGFLAGLAYARCP